MKLDLAKDQKRIRRYILQRIKDYPHYVNDGPGDDEDPIQLVTRAYYHAQTGYFALVFDTRKSADNDGSWTLHLNDETTLLHFPRWCAFLESWYAGNPCQLALPDGSTCRVTQQTHTHEEIAQLFGEMLRDTMLRLRDEGALQDLPLALDAFLIVEEFDGHWGWPASYETRKNTKLNLDSPQASQTASEEESEDDREKALLKRIRKLPLDGQISFWITELNRRAHGKPSELDHVFLGGDFPILGNEIALDELERIGQKSVTPLFELVRKLSRLPEWKADRPKRHLGETPMQNVAIGAIWKVRNLGFATGTVEKLLHQIIRTACKANATRRLWGIIPYHAAVCLNALFDGYPTPAWEPRTNRLKSPERFQRRPDQ